MRDHLRLTDDRTVWLMVCGGTLLLLALIALAPVMIAHHQTFPAAMIYRSLGWVCHQTPARSFHLANHPLAVCARCLGLYAGFGIGALIFPLRRPLSTNQALIAPARRWLLLALIPTVIDLGLDFLGWWENTHASRVTTGLLLGAALSFYVLPGLISLFRQGREIFARERGGL